MGVGYMIVPRFRNVSLAFVKYAYLSFILVLISLIGQVVVLVQLTILSNLLFFIMIVIITPRFVGITAFVTIILLMLKFRPKRLRLSDYFIALSVVTLLTMNIIELVQMSGLIYSEEDIITATSTVSYPLIHIELWLLFPIIMIFGIEHKTLPSFLGFIRPRSIVGLSSVILISSCVMTGLLPTLFDAKLLIPHLIFNMLFFASVVTFVLSIYAFGGFNNSHIIRTIKGEKR